MYVLDITIYVSYRDTLLRLELFIKPHILYIIYIYIYILYIYIYNTQNYDDECVYIVGGCVGERPSLKISSIIKFSLNILKVLQMELTHWMSK